MTFKGLKRGVGSDGIYIFTDIEDDVIAPVSAPAHHDEPVGAKPKKGK